MKRALAIAAIAILVPMACAGEYFVLKSRAIRSMDEKYRQIARDDDVGSVIQSFGEPHQVRKNPERLYWDDVAVERGAGEVDEYQYTISTFYLPITWAFGVDKSGRVISKHRYD